MLSCEFVTVTAAAGNDIDIVAVYSRFQEMMFPVLYIVEASINRKHGHKSNLAREEKLDMGVQRNSKEFEHYHRAKG